MIEVAWKRSACRRFLGVVKVNLSVLSAQIDKLRAKASA